MIDRGVGGGGIFGDQTSISNRTLLEGGRKRIIYYSSSKVNLRTTDCKDSWDPVEYISSREDRLGLRGAGGGFVHKRGWEGGDNDDEEEEKVLVVGDRNSDCSSLDVGLDCEIGKLFMRNIGTIRIKNQSRGIIRNYNCTVFLLWKRY